MIELETDSPSAEKPFRIDKNLAAITSLYDAIPASILIIDPHERLMGWNLFSRDRVNARPESEMLGINPMDRVHPDDLPDLLKKGYNVLENDIEETAQFRMYHGDGPPYKWATMRAKKAVIDGQPYVVAVVTEITELKDAEAKQEQLQMQLRQHQKMQLIGQFAEGIAHDFNNILFGILGNTEILLDQINEASPLAEQINDIHQLATHSAKLTSQLLTFARKDLTYPEVIDLNKAISEFLPLHPLSIGNNVQIEFRACEIEPFTHMDRDQLDQILSNLIINARDAIAGSGNILIECDLVHFEKEDGNKCLSGISPGSYIKLSISDTGKGIETRIFPHIFEPFFTTKEIGKGTGLGLSTVYGIVMQNNGHIECRSKLGQGTTFDIYLPQHREFEQKKTEAIEHIIPKGKGMILVVSNDSCILNLIREILENRGFKVLIAHNAEESIVLAEIHKNLIDLLVTDVLLPTMNGVNLSSRLQENDPRLKVLFISGYVPENIVNARPTEEGLDIIQKPFSINEFIKAIDKLLNHS
ncbi:MAG: response regulator [Chlorobiaceae bacterium]|nr:response regulator [Chlorobiaceae bacterium]